ncbi:MAG: N-acyl homoserine lactonase family protein [Dehalococcoidia bacterium]|nr:N-acyl homoserine lactonase family protein [Dehalococcoidia bacterium]
MGGTQYTITPVTVGTLTIERPQFVWGQGWDSVVQCPVLMFYVEGGGQRIMVDTGCADPEWGSKYHKPFARKPEEEPAKALAAIGVDPAEIDIVIATHLHWDHCYNHVLFTNARFLVQRIELQYAAAPYPIHANVYEAPTTGMTPAYSRTKFEVLDGDYDLADGLKLVSAPGHAPGMQCPLINTAKGLYYIAGDNVPLYENLEGNKFGRPIPGMIYADLGAYYNTFRRMESLADHILPGHDSKVLDQSRYG